MLVRCGNCSSVGCRIAALAGNRPALLLHASPCSFGQSAYLLASALLNAGLSQPPGLPENARNFATSWCANHHHHADAKVQAGDSSFPMSKKVKNHSGTTWHPSLQAASCHEQGYNPCSCAPPRPRKCKEPTATAVLLMLSHSRKCTAPQRLQSLWVPCTPCSGTAQH